MCPCRWPRTTCSGDIGRGLSSHACRARHGSPVLILPCGPLRAQRHTLSSPYIATAFHFLMTKRFSPDFGLTCFSFSSASSTVVGSTCRERSAATSPSVLKIGTRTTAHSYLNHAPARPHLHLLYVCHPPHRTCGGLPSEAFSDALWTPRLKFNKTRTDVIRMSTITDVTSDSLKVGEPHVDRSDPVERSSGERFSISHSFHVVKRTSTSPYRQTTKHL